MNRIVQILNKTGITFCCNRNRLIILCKQGREIRAAMNIETIVLQAAFFQQANELILIFGSNVQIGRFAWSRSFFCKGKRGVIGFAGGEGKAFLSRSKHRERGGQRGRIGKERGSL